MITELPRTIAAPPGEAPGADADGHPMRAVTRSVAFEPGWWDDDRRREVAAFFDALAPGWGSHDVPGREAPLIDALDRGLAAAPPAPAGWRTCIDVGGGTGLAAQVLASRFSHVVTCDIAVEMLRHAPPGTPGLLQADASRLPVPDASLDALALSNCFLFPDEADRVLAPHGVIVWVNSRGTATPIHLPAHDVVAALPGAWTGVAAEAGWGTWAVVWRAP